MNAGSFPANDDSTFMINPAGNQDSGSGSMRQQRPPVSASDFNHMFSPIQLVRMFQQGASADESNSNGDTQNSTSIAGMLWNKHGPGDQGGGGGGGDISGSMDGAGDTLKQLMSNGSNPVDSQRRQQQRQEQQEQFMAMVENESLITPSSPPETVMSPSSALDDVMSMHYQNSVTEGSLRRSSSARVAATQQSVTSSMPANSSVANRRSVQYDGRSMPPIPSSPQLRPSSRMSLASYGSSNNIGNARNYAIQPPASARPSGSSDHYYYSQQPNQQRYISGRPNSSRPVPMHGVNSAAADFTSHPLQIHSAVVPSTRYIQQQQQPPPPPQHQLPPVPPPSQSYMQGDMSLRHEVLDKVARRSQPSTPYDVQVPPVSSSQRPPSSMAPRPGSSTDYGHPQQPLFTPDDITVLPGDSRMRAYLWSQNNNQNNGDDNNDSSAHPQSQQPPRQRQNQLKSSSSYTSGLNRPASSARYNSLRRNDPAALAQVRKTSDSSAHLLTPKDFNMPLPDRVGDMVLDKRLGEWVHISEYSPQMGRGDSPNMRANTSHISSNSGYQQQQQQQQQMDSPQNPTSGRSSMSIHSYASAFPQPLPTNNDSGGGASHNNHSRAGSMAIGMGMVSPVEHQQHGAIREMSERKIVRRDSAAQRRPIVDEALGSIVQRLMTPATSPDGCTALDLSGSGIRNLSGLAQLTSRLEAICLSGNKLRSLSGLPTGLVSLRAPSNWIRFSAGDADKFSFARELPHLEEIDLSANEIADIGVFSGLRHLRSLELSRNRIESLSELRGCRRLLVLSLRDNIVTDFDLEPSEAPLLSTLDMYNNRIRVVPAGIAGFMNLMKVNMVKNDLECVDLGGAPAESVRELRLSENPLLMRRNSGVVEVGAWRAKFPNLKTLYLDICNIRQFARPVDASSPKSASDSLSLTASSPPSSASWSSLFNLSLRGNALQPLLAIDFDCLSSLKNLYAPDTQTVLPRTLPIMGQLLQLVLCNAGLTRLPSNLGSALPQLKLLDVSSNPELNDMQPLLQLASSLEVLRCRAVGFGDGSTAIPGVQVFPDVPGDSNNSNNSSFTQDSASECTLLRNLAKLRRLRRLDLRFNRCNADLYAPPPVLPSQAMQNAGAAGNGGAAALSLDGALSPQMSGQGDAGAAQGLVSSARIDEEMWLRQDHAFVLNLKLARLTHLTQRRDNYWILAISLFPRLEELDGIKVGPH
ncbi:hypothetical protein GGI15_002425 [Coemansia interrupta]|uniref:Uncharacterized protein n=1 Tax=Coemansia interrupta TaxID=1126814 RepID=A0A9W8HJP8_9FUNG|nr:hypothetical protein GGI15_002425 [Coemansia interrupta]